MTPLLLGLTVAEAFALGWVACLVLQDLKRKCKQ